MRYFSDSPPLNPGQMYSSFPFPFLLLLLILLTSPLPSCSLNIGNKPPADTELGNAATLCARKYCSASSSTSSSNNVDGLALWLTLKETCTTTQSFLTSKLYSSGGSMSASKHLYSPSEVGNWCGFAGLGGLFIGFLFGSKYPSDIFKKFVGGERGMIPRKL